MNLDELQSVRSRERQADSPQNLRATFYQDAAEFIEELRRERDRAAEQAEDPFASEEVRRLTDDIETARSTVEAIYERRVGKVVKRASIAAAGMPTERDGLTEEEQALFDALVDRIEANRAHVLDEVLESGGSDVSLSRDGGADQADSDAAPASEPDPGSDGPSGSGSVDAADLMGGADDDPVPEFEPEPGPDAEDDGEGAPDADDESSAGSAGRDAIDRTTVRITRDVGEIFGVDERSYDLAAEDVVTLPAANADPLVEKDAAERLD